MTDTYYRFEDKRYSVADEYGDHSYTRLDVELYRFEVVKRTPKGVWLLPRRFVLNSAHKRYACPSIKEAWASFVARKEKEARIYRARAQMADNAVHIGSAKFHKELSQ